MPGSRSHRSSSSRRSQRRGRSSTSRAQSRSSRGSSASSQRSQTTTDSGVASATSSKFGAQVQESGAYEEIQLTESHCRVVHFPRGSQAFKVVCCNGVHTCAKSGHKKTPEIERGAEGYYQVSRTKSGKLNGGIYDTYESSEARLARVTAVRTTNRELQAGIQGLQVPSFFEVPESKDKKPPAIGNPGVVNDPFPAYDGPNLLDNDGVTSDDKINLGVMSTVPETATATESPAVTTSVQLGIPLKSPPETVPPTLGITSALPASSQLVQVPNMSKPSSLRAALPAAPSFQSANPTAAPVPAPSGAPAASPSAAPFAPMPAAVAPNATVASVPPVVTGSHTTTLASTTFPAASTTVPGHSTEPGSVPSQPTAPIIPGPMPLTTNGGMDPNFVWLTNVFQQMMTQQNQMMEQLMKKEQAPGPSMASVAPSAAPSAPPASMPPTAPTPDAPKAPPMMSNPMTAPTDGPLPTIHTASAAAPASIPSVTPAAGPSILKSSNLYATQNPVAPPRSTVQQSQDASHLQNLLAGSIPSGNPHATVPPPSTDLGTFASVMDPSQGSKEEVYGLKLHNAVELTKGLVPPALAGTYESAKRFCEGLNDICAQPNVEGTSAAQEVESSLAESLKNLTNNRDALSGGKIDSSYSNVSRNALRRVTTLAALQKLLASVNEEQQNTLKTMMGDFCTTIQFYLPAVDYDTASMMVNNCILFRVGSRTLEIYLLFLSTMLSMGLTQGWEVCKVAIGYHSDKFAKIRARYSTRIQVLMANYVHLRENMSSKFCPPDFLSLRMDLLQQSYTSGSFEGPSICPHCKTMIHGDGPCPWQQEKASNAQKKAAKALRDGVRTGNGGGGGGGGNRNNRNNGGGGNGSNNSSGGNNGSDGNSTSST